MGWIEAVVTLLSALAWPMAVVVLALVFREPVRRLLSAEHGRLKAGPLDYEWRRAEAAAKPAVESLKVSHRESTTEADTATAAVSPRTAILNRFVELMAPIGSALAELDQDEAAYSTPAEALDLAAKLGVVSHKTQEALVGLMVLRNLAAHSPGGEVTQTRATDFLNLAEAVEFAVRHDLDAWRRRVPGEPPTR